MTNISRKPMCKQAENGGFLPRFRVTIPLNLLAIPAGLEPATPGLEGPKPNTQICGFEAYRPVNGAHEFIEKTRSDVNGISQ